MCVVPLRRSRLRDALAVLKGTCLRKPVVIARDDDGLMRSSLRRLVPSRCFDIIHADQTSMAQYALYARARLPDAGARRRVRLVLERPQCAVPRCGAAPRDGGRSRATQNGPLVRREDAIWIRRNLPGDLITWCMSTGLIAPRFLQGMTRTTQPVL